MMKNAATFALIMTLPILAACSTTMEGATQQVSFKSVGADDAFCTIQTGSNDYRYDVRPPQTIWVQKSRKPMYVSCTAPGNRVQNLMVESEVAGTTFLNTLNAGLGAGWDAESGAMFKYPEEVVIDFSATPAKEQPLPAYMNAGALPAEAQGIEDLGPDDPALAGDRALAEKYRAAYAADALLQSQKAADTAERDRRINALDGGFYGDKGGEKSKYVPPKTSPVDMTDAPVNTPVGEESVAIPKQATGGKTMGGKTTTAAPVVTPPDTAVTVPQAPALGKPLFPATTSF